MMHDKIPLSDIPNGEERLAKLAQWVTRPQSLMMQDKNPTPISAHHPLADTWRASTNLITRFFEDEKPELRAAYEKLNEEVLEFITALIELKQNRRSVVNRGNVLSEAADVLVTLINALYAADLPLEEFEAALEGVNKKNNAKTKKTHEVRGGKIARRILKVSDE